jgi:tetratricopeptide (TPR) repeat protein
MRPAASERFRNGVAKAVAQLGGDRAAAARSGVSKSAWYDAKSGRAVPDERTNWPAMRALLETVPARLTGVPDWEDLYQRVCAERGRRPPFQRTAPPGTTRPAPHHLPPGTLPFVAREAESKLLSESVGRAGTQSTPIVVIAGPPGVGKTALAVNWAHRMVDRFLDGSLYVDLQGWGPSRAITADEVLPAWLRAVGLDPAALPDDVTSRSTALRSALTGRRMLIVLDNARSEEQVRPLLPGSPSCVVLVTSRQELEGLAIHHGARVVSLVPLTPAGSAGLLGEIAGRDIAADAPEIARLCGHLPLALRIVAESVRTAPPAEVAAMIDELKGEDRLDRLGSDDPRTDLRTVISWSFRQLPAAAQDMFRLLGRFPGRTFDTSVVAALTGTRPAQAAARLRTLTRASLVHPEPDRRFAMHDLIRDYAAELSVAEPDGEARLRLFRYYLHTSQQADAWLAPRRYQLTLPGTAPVPAPFHDFQGALRWFEAESRTMVSLCLAAERESERNRTDPLRWRLAFQLKSFYFLSKQTQEWLLSHEAALEAAVRTGDRGGEAMTRNNLGLAWHERGDDERALPHYEAAERLFALVDDLHGVSNAIANQAVVYRRRGDLSRALALNERALEFYRRAAVEHPDSRRYVAITLRSIALVETEAHEYARAEGHLSEAIGLCGELGMAMDLGRGWNALGRVLMLAGRFAEAHEAYEAAVAAGQACASRFEEAVARRGLGAVAAATGDDDRARECWNDAHAMLTLLGSAKADEVRADLAALDAGQVP